jgi:hypothetical protein
LVIFTVYAQFSPSTSLNLYVMQKGFVWKNDLKIKNNVETPSTDGVDWAYSFIRAPWVTVYKFSIFL